MCHQIEAGEQRRALEKRLTREQKAKADLESQVRRGLSSTRYPPPNYHPTELARTHPHGRASGQVEELASYTEAQRKRREARAGSIAGRLMSDFLGGVDDTVPLPVVSVPKQ